MRDRHRSALGNLLLELRNHAPAGPQHIAEAHGDEPRRMPLHRHVRQHHLRRPLRRAHHIRRIDRLVGRDQHEALCPRLGRRSRRVPGAQGVVLQRRPRVLLLHQRHMLERRRMEHDVRALRVEGCAQMFQVLHVAHQPHQRQMWVQLAQLLLDLVQRELAQLVQHHLGRPVQRNLAAQLRPDGAARACHQHRLAGDQCGHAGFVELDRIAPQQILRLDRAHPLDARRALAQLAERWHRQHRQPGRRCQLDRAPSLRRSGARHRRDDVRGTGGHFIPHRVVQRAQHGRAEDAGPALGGVVVQQAQHDPALLVQASQQQPRRLAGTHHDRTLHLTVAAGDARAGMLVQHAIHDAHHAQAHQRDDRMQREHGARHLAQLQHQHEHRAGQAGHGASQGQALDFPVAGEAPHPARDAGHVEGQQVHRDHAEHHPRVVARPR